MKSIFKIALSSAALLTAINANAVQQDITVTADIDPTIAITQADNSALPASITMQYLPSKGLEAYRNNIKLWSNTADRDLNVSLASSPSLTDQSGNNAIPLSVTLNGQKLSATTTVFNYATTFPAGITNGSAAMPLIISQTTAGVATASGKYSGIVSLVVTQATAKNAG
ncbi:CS1 type fimbrial major subunit [Serratia fonticola]|uniref:CS1 type fimbrial major subunit n=1 Tax=Serratia fonticola TaxID=47917 RepID=A0AAJ1Y818_SERFO|nr:CS1 type fimbrial major subunit [Serratia fonticola]MDQ9125478.1 CS1 type fimbrial major subunit [Serratia fonticola]